MGRVLFFEWASNLQNTDGLMDFDEFGLDLIVNSKFYLLVVLVIFFGLSRDTKIRFHDKFD